MSSVFLKCGCSIFHFSLDTICLDCGLICGWWCIPASKSDEVLK